MKQLILRNTTSQPSKQQTNILLNISVACPVNYCNWFAVHTKFVFITGISFKRLATFSL